MSEKKFTPGPWTGSRDRLPDVHDKDGKLVAVVYAPKTRECDSEEGHANARLIAAAPEMYEACQAALDYDAAIQRYAARGKQWVQGDDLDALYKDWLAKSLIAIEKASGLSVDGRVQAAIDNVLD